MLFWPLVDRRWDVPTVSYDARNIASWCALAISIGGLLLWQPRYLGFAVSTLLVAALPEEWFFRAYFMLRMGSGWRANLTASLLFSLLHGLAWGLTTAILVFVPSLFFGWLYQRTRDLILLVLTHTLSNLVFVLFIADLLTARLKLHAV